MDDLRLFLLVIGAAIVIAVYVAGRRNHSPASDYKQTQDSEPWLQEIDERIALGYHKQSEEVSVGGKMVGIKTTPADDKATENGSSPDYDELMYRLNQLESKRPRFTLQKQSGKPSKQTNKAGYIAKSNTETAAVTASLGIDPLVIVLNVIARDGGQFDGQLVKSALDQLGLCFGDMSIYHYYPEGDPELGHKQPSLFSVASAVEPGRFDISDVTSFKTPGLSLILQLPGPMEGILAFELLQHVANVLARQLGGIVCDGTHRKITPQSTEHLKEQISEFNIKLQTSHQPMLH